MDQTALGKCWEHWDVWGSPGYFSLCCSLRWIFPQGYLVIDNPSDRNREMKKQRGCFSGSVSPCLACNLCMEAHVLSKAERIGEQRVLKVTTCTPAKDIVQPEQSQTVPSIPSKPWPGEITFELTGGLGNISESGQDFTTPDTVSFSGLSLTKEFWTGANCQVCSGFVKQTASQRKLGREHHSYWWRACAAITRWTNAVKNRGWGEMGKGLFFPAMTMAIKSSLAPESCWCYGVKS